MHALIERGSHIQHFSFKQEETWGWRGALCLVERVLHWVVTAADRKTWPLDRFINGPRTKKGFWRLRVLLLYGKV